MLSGLSRCAGLVMAPKTEQPLKHIEFVNLGPGRALVVTVTQSGHVENRVIDTPIGMPPSALVEASNYLNARLMRPHLRRCAPAHPRRPEAEARRAERPHRAGDRVGPRDLGRRTAAAR